MAFLFRTKIVVSGSAQLKSLLHFNSSILNTYDPKGLILFATYSLQRPDEQGRRCSETSEGTVGVKESGSLKKRAQSSKSCL